MVQFYNAFGERDIRIALIRPHDQPMGGKTDSS